MKRTLKNLTIIMAAVLSLSLTGCGSSVPDRATRDKNKDESEIESRGTTESDSASSDTTENSSLFQQPDSDNESSSAVDFGDISIPDVSVPSINIPDIAASSFSLSSDTSESSSSNSSSLFFDLGDTQTIGNAVRGYLDIPADFVKFEDVVQNTDLQYSDRSATTIFTLNLLGNGDPDSNDLEISANSMAMSLKDKGATGITGAKVKVAGKYDAYQVYGYWPDDDTFLVVDLFNTSTKSIYLAVEFPSDNMEIVEYLDTYREYR